MSESAAEEAVRSVGAAGRDRLALSLCGGARTSANHARRSRRDLARPLVCAMTPWWQIQGRAIATRTMTHIASSGQNVARQFALLPAASSNCIMNAKSPALHRSGRNQRPATTKTIKSSPTSPRSRISRVLPDRIGLIQLRMPGIAAGDSIGRVAAQECAARLEARPIRQISETEGSLLGSVFSC